MKLFITSLSVFFFSTLAFSSGAFNLQASVVSTIPLPPAKLGFLFSSQTINTNACSQLARAETLNANNQPVNVTVNTVVKLTGSSGMTFYDDVACTVPVIQVIITPGASSHHYYFKSSEGGTRTIILSNPSLTIAEQTETIVEPTWDFAFYTAAQRVNENHCSAVVGIEARNTLDQVSNVVRGIFVSLSATNTKLFSDSACTKIISAAYIPPGTSKASFYFESPTKGSATITASAGNYEPATQTEAITDPAASLKFTSASQSVLSGHCSAAVGIETLDQSGSATNVSANTVVSLAGSPAIFYSNSTCTTPITSVTIPAGSGSVHFYFSDSNSGTLTIGISSSTFASQLQKETITSSASLLAFNTAPQTVADGACSNVVQVQTRDKNGNPTNVTASTVVNVSGSPALYYSDSACSHQIGSVTINSGTDAANFYFKNANQGNFSVNVSATNFSSISQTETISPPPQHQVSLSWTASVSSGIAAYHVFRGTQNAGPYSFLGATTSSELSFDDKTVGAGQTYYYVVTALNAQNVESADSTQATAVIPSP